MTPNPATKNPATKSLVTKNPGTSPVTAGLLPSRPENRDVDDASAYDGAAFKLGEMDLDEYDTEHAISRKLLDRM